MVFSDALEVAIGLTFVFLLLSLAMSAAVESIETLLRTRGSRLLDGIGELLGDPARAQTGIDAAKAIYTHPLVQGLFAGQFDEARLARRLPSYIPSRSFALALLDQVLAGRIDAAQGTRASVPSAMHASLGERLALAAERIDNEPLRHAMLQAARIGGNDLEATVRHLEHWFDSAMDRVSGRFKRRSQHWLFLFGLGAAVVLNVNTITLADGLSKNSTLRRAVVAEVEQRQAGGQLTAVDGKDALQTIDRLGLPIGWSAGAIETLARPLHSREGGIDGLSGALGVLQIATGYLLTALAITLGAPFWFDTLNKLMVIRGTVKPREKSREEGSEDRPAAAERAQAMVAAVAAAAAPPPAPPPAVPPAERPIDTEVHAEPPQAGDKPFEEFGS